MKKHLACALAAIFVGCGPKAAPEHPTLSTKSATGEAKPLEKAPPGELVDVSVFLSREIDLPQTRFAITGLDGHFNAKVRASTAPEISASVDKMGKPMMLLTANIGTTSPISCSIMPKKLDLGATVRSIMARVKGHFRKGDVLVTAHDQGSLTFVDVQLITDEKMLAEPKIAVATFDDGGMLCVHDEPGYHKAYREFVKDLVAVGTFRSTVPSKFLEVAAIKGQGVTIGLGERRVVLVSGVRTEFSTLSLVAAGKEILFDDYAESATLNAKGDLLAYFSGSNDERGQSSLEVKRKDELFSYEGTYRGHKLEGTFPSTTPLTTELWMSRKLQNLKTGTEVSWSEITNKTGTPVKVTIRKDKAGAVTRQVNHDAPEPITLDKSGLFYPSSALAFERILQKGTAD